MRKAKIIATLGPASNTVEMITSLINAGMDVARINMSHGTYEAHAKVIENIRISAKKCKKNVGILLDLQGPKIRVDKLPQPLTLQKDEIWVIGSSKIKDQYSQYADCFIPTIYEKLVQDSVVGCTILFDDGNLEAIAVEKEQDVLKIKVIVGGILKSNKGINLPDLTLSAPSFTQKDQEDLLFGLQHGIDYVALSFVRSAQDVIAVKSLMHQLKVECPIIAKIEKPQALDNIISIIDACDGIMIARGDMGVEVGNHRVPLIQKNLIAQCNSLGKFVITATQMLESMIEHPRPTRAEATDVANAIWDGTDAIMLSGETASGNYPVETITMMNLIVMEAQGATNLLKTRLDEMIHDQFRSIVWSTQAAAAFMAEKIQARWILSFTESGISVSKLAHYRPTTPIIAICSRPSKVTSMSIYWGVTPIYVPDKTESLEEYENFTLAYLIKENYITNGDKLVITHGDGKYFLPGRTDTVKVEIVRGPIQSSEKEHIHEVSWDKGRLLHDVNVCASCQVCVSVCPFGIWKVDDSSSKGNTIIVESNVHQCTLDFECVEHCPTGAIELLI